ncbi:MAG: AAA family ATPase, partial [Nitriliruptorales bacterium]|nr:AAA family ATPase [Nitriliruptorales bacterium]
MRIQPAPQRSVRGTRLLMRPLRLELHGFTAFREQVVVDFTGADLFALSGPTGAGKSSIIDGMCFALYGSVPRLDRRTVAPVISMGKVEARIRFDFTVADREFSAVRVVRRTANGASTKEARLEHEGQVVAGDADGMTAAVEHLLGLGFEQFTKSVVLPQGEFARFLHDKPSARQELLVKLLELGVYEGMRGDASSRQSAAQGAADQIQRQLDTLADITGEARDAAAARVERLTALREEIDQAQPHLDALLRRCQGAEREAAEAEQAVEVLSAVAVPDGLVDLSRACDAAEAAARTSAEGADAADARVVAAEQAREAGGDMAVLQRLLEDHTTRTTLSQRMARGREVVTQKLAAEERALAALNAAEAAAERAAAAVSAAQREHAAHAVAATLVAGEPCPVCLQIVDDLPSRPTPAAMETAEAARAAAERERWEAAAAARAAEQDRTKVEQHLDLLGEQLDQVEQRLVDAPPENVLAEQLAAIAGLEAALVAARKAARAARAAAARARQAAEEARRLRDGAWRVFDAARDT